MTTVSNPVKAYVATLNAGGFVSHGQSLTVTVNITQQWETQAQFGVRYGSNVSLATVVNIYPTNDGGATFDTVPLQSFAIPTTASVNRVSSIRLTTGMYAIQMLSSSPSTTFFVLTQEQITSVINV